MLWVGISQGRDALSQVGMIRDYQPASAVVERSWLDASTSNRGTNYHVRVRFRYEIDGTVHRPASERTD